MKNRIAKITLITSPVLLIILFLLDYFLFDKENKDVKTIIFVTTFVLLFIPIIYLFLTLFSKFLSIFSIKLTDDEIFNSIALGLPLNTDIFLNEKSKLSYAYNFFGDLLINIFYYLFLVLIFILSLFITLKITNFIL